MANSLDLLAIKEKISINLSSSQIVQILNDIINAAAKPLFKHSHLMRQLVLQSLLQTQVDHRRKISIHSKEATASCIVYGIIQNNYSAIKLCELDRNILFSSINYIQPYLKEALIVEKKLLKSNSSKYLKKQQNIAKITGIPINMLTALARWVLPYLDLYLQFRECIIYKYIKFAYQQAKRSESNTQLFVDVEELHKNYLLALGKAIDKFDANKGTLTSYIVQWLLSARSAPEFNHQYNTAYDLPANVRKDMENRGVALQNMSTPIDDKHLEIGDDNVNYHIQEMSKDKLFLNCLRHITGIKVPFQVLDLPIVLKPEEISNLQGLLPANTGKVN